MCVNYVAEVALKMLPEDLSGLMGKIGSIEMYFDRNERFMRTIIGPWQRHRKKPGALKLIHNIEQVKTTAQSGFKLRNFSLGTRIVIGGSAMAAKRICCCDSE